MDSSKVKLSIEFSQEGGQPTLSYSIHNGLDKAIKVINDTGLYNHSGLEIKKDGQAVSFSDLTHVASNPIHATYVKESNLLAIPPGETVKVKDAIFAKDDDSKFNLTWGPMVYIDLSGEYELQITTREIEPKYYSDGQWLEDSSIFPSSLKSDTIKIQL